MTDLNLDKNIFQFLQIRHINKVRAVIIIKCIFGSFKCVFNRYIVRTLFSNKIISTPININGNISYEGILKHSKYRCDYLVSFFIYREL